MKFTNFLKEIVLKRFFKGAITGCFLSAAC